MYFHTLSIHSLHINFLCIHHIYSFLLLFLHLFYSFFTFSILLLLLFLDLLYSSLTSSTLPYYLPFLHFFYTFSFISFSFLVLLSTIFLCAVTFYSRNIYHNGPRRDENQPRYESRSHRCAQCGPGNGSWRSTCRMVCISIGGCGAYRILRLLQL